jgi:GNAT superfamily N-acetyltransferase
MIDRVKICQPGALASDAARMAEIDAIFFEASATRSFPSEIARAMFHERWLGRYLAHNPDDALVATDADGRVVGYLVGARDDPARSPRYADIPYFADLADLTALYPAHLHINLAPQARGHGIGARLVDEFVRRLISDGTPGFHVVTGAQSRNRTFYARMGLLPLRELVSGGTPIVMLGRRLDTALDRPE